MALISGDGSLRNLTLEELEDAAHRQGEKPYRARQLAQWLYKKNACDWPEIKNIPRSFLDSLRKQYCLCSLSMSSRLESCRDHSVKYLLKTSDGNFIETVLIPQGGRKTQCLSTQIGCKMGCLFCASGQGGFVRNLSCGEILDQIAFVAKDTGSLPTNLVYMGMGEPFDNYDAVVKSIRIANASWGFGIGQRRITVSTVGIVPGIRRFSEEGLNQIKLAVSLHSPDDAVRTRLIPANRKYNIPEILKALEEAEDKFKRQITFEYLLAGEVTDRDEDAVELAGIAKMIHAKVNLIPCNSVLKEFRPPAERRILEFQKVLEKEGIRVTVRRSAGQDIAAACGQLRLQEGSVKRET